jgi:hypothetical protein
MRACVALIRAVVLFLCECNQQCSDMTATLILFWCSTVLPAFQNAARAICIPHQQTASHIAQSFASSLLLLQAGYLFPEIARRRNAYLAANPDGRPIISLGIGDTTLPIPEHILSGLIKGASQLGKKETYSG